MFTSTKLQLVNLPINNWDAKNLKRIDVKPNTNKMSKIVVVKKYIDIYIISQNFINHHKSFIWQHMSWPRNTFPLLGDFFWATSSGSEDILNHLLCLRLIDLDHPFGWSEMRVLMGGFWITQSLNHPKFVFDLKWITQSLKANSGNRFLLAHRLDASDSFSYPKVSGVGGGKSMWQVNAWDLVRS